MEDSILPDTPQRKQCSVCKQFFPSTNQFFAKNARAIDGLNTGCKQCRNAYKQTYRSTPEGKRKSQQYYIDNHDAIRAQQRNSYAEHRDTTTAYFRRRVAKLQDGEKLCYGCEQIFPATFVFFPRNKNYSDGLHTQCRACANAYVDQHRKDLIISWSRYRKENADKIKQYRDAHKSDRALYDKQYIHTERGIRVTRTKVANRRAHKKNAQVNHTAEDIQLQYKRQKGKCYYCKHKLGKSRRNYHVDHIFPLSKGGSNGPDNLVITCPTCNLSKHDKLLHEWPKGGRLL
jgi:5-methylcytosine-specific restriction endonuclease McrA